MLWKGANVDKLLGEARQLHIGAIRAVVTARAQPWTETLCYGGVSHSDSHAEFFLTARSVLFVTYDESSLKPQYFKQTL